MTLLTLGVIVFALVHFIPSLAPGIKARAQAGLGDNGWKGLFSLTLLLSLAMMIVGWRHTQPAFLYSPPQGLHLPAIGLLLIAFLLLVASARPTRLRLYIRHPQLTGVALWSIGHLLLNGDQRSLILFGGLAAWAIGEMIAINRRDGGWTKESPPGWGQEVFTLIITVTVVTLVVQVHPWLSGKTVYW
ncbi:MAG: NnrU family protein [Pseudomonadota bacterium]